MFRNFDSKDLGLRDLGMWFRPTGVCDKNTHLERIRVGGQAFREPNQGLDILYYIIVYYHILYLLHYISVFIHIYIYIYIHIIHILQFLQDLGVSSPQLDDISRGFSSKSRKDGPPERRVLRRLSFAYLLLL